MKIFNFKIFIRFVIVIACMGSTTYSINADYNGNKELKRPAEELASDRKENVHQ